jgi:acyl carrier protein
MTGPDAELVLAVVRDAVVRVYEVDPATVVPGTRLVEDLGADSLGLVEIVEIVEAELARVHPGFRIEDDDLDDLTSVGVAVDYALARLAARCR